MLRHRRRKSGSAIIETGPALYVFLLLIFFPMIDLMFIALDFGGCWFLNHSVTREVALRRQADWGAAITDIDGPFKAGGIGQFMHITSSSHTTTNLGQPTDPDRMKVRVVSDITCAPFLQLPIPGAIPGLSGPVTFRFTSERSRENDLP